MAHCGRPRLCSSHSGLVRTNRRWAGSSDRSQSGHSSGWPIRPERPTLVLHPGPILERWAMPDMLVMAARELRDPVAAVVLVVAGDRPMHSGQPRFGPSGASRSVPPPRHRHRFNLRPYSWDVRQMRMTGNEALGCGGFLAISSAMLTTAPARPGFIGPSPASARISSCSPMVTTPTTPSSGSSSWCFSLHCWCSPSSPRCGSGELALATPARRTRDRGKDRWSTPLRPSCDSVIRE